MYKDLEQHIDEFQGIVQDLRYCEDEFSNAELYYNAGIIHRNYIEHKKLLLEEQKLEAFKQAHAIHPNVPSALEAIAMCLGMEAHGKLSNSISDKLSEVADAINKD